MNIFAQCGESPIARSIMVKLSFQFFFLLMKFIMHLQTKLTV